MEKDMQFWMILAQMLLTRLAPELIGQIEAAFARATAAGDVARDQLVAGLILGAKAAEAASAPALLLEQAKLQRRIAELEAGQ